MNPTMSPSTLASANTPLKYQNPDLESDDMKTLNQENAALLARVAALESKAELQHRIILYGYKERKALTRENNDLHHQVGYLEECLQRASIKHEEMADKVDTLECIELAQDWIITNMRQKNHEVARELGAVLSQIERLKAALQMVSMHEQETARQLSLAKSGFAKRFELIKKERGALRRRVNQYAQERRDLTKQVEELNLKYQDAARSQFHILQAFSATIEELEAIKADHADEKGRHEQTWRLIAKWSNLRAKRHSDITNRLQKELDAKSLKIQEQSQTIRQHTYVIEEVYHILNSLSPELKEAIKEENRVLKKQESTTQDDEDETCSNYSDSAETIVYTPQTESAEPRAAWVPEGYRRKFL
ncbi:hypothetical protein DL98DRAFT_580387 [Cadophora sp. DSE1049]|nr:hypothetical protein DL98DRAFT_580387 [Cadophora sp. DSE1049]